MAALAEDVVLDGRESVGRGHGGREGRVLRRLLVADHPASAKVRRQLRPDARQVPARDDREKKRLVSSRGIF